MCVYGNYDNRDCVDEKITLCKYKNYIAPTQAPYIFIHFGVKNDEFDDYNAMNMA